MIFISLTTVPLRLELWSSFEQNLQSLLNQKTDKEYKVLLNIPYHYKNHNKDYVIPEQLLSLIESNPKLVLNRVNEDYGPVVKVTGALSYTSDPNDIIIACDDDQVYYENMLEYHLKKRAQYPDSAICFRGDVPIDKREWEEDGVTKYLLKPTHFYFPVKHDAQLLVPGHWHSVGYLRGFFKDDFYDVIPLSDNDDTIIAYYFKKNQIDFICAKWDDETDWRPVNDSGRPAHSYPIKHSLPYENSGFYEFRIKAGDGYGRAEKQITDLLHNHDIIFIKKNG